MSAADRHPDDLADGLHFAIKTLSTSTVRRAVGPADALRVALRHNLRRGNDDHRHRSRIDPSRTPLNLALVGDLDPEQVADLAERSLSALGLAYPPRRDAVAGFEIITQPPEGTDLGAFWSAALRWVHENFEHLLAAVVHLDQRRPHMHVVVLPVLSGRLAGADMQRGAYGAPRLRQRFMAFIRAELGLRPDRKVKTLADLMVSPGRGPKTAAAAARRDLALMRSTGAGLMGMNVGGHERRPVRGATSMPTTSNIAQPFPVPDPLEKVRLLWAQCFNRAEHPVAPLAPCPTPRPMHATACLPPRSRYVPCQFAEHNY